MVLADVNDSSLRKFQQVTKQKVERLLKRVLFQDGYTIPNNLESKTYILNLCDYKCRENDEITLGFSLKKGKNDFCIFYRFDGTMAIFEKAYIHECMQRKDKAPFYKEAEKQTDVFQMILKK